MNCRDCVEFLMAYLDGELPDMTREEFERHLELCAPCLQYLESYQITVRVCRSALAGDGGPKEIPESLVKAILAARQAGGAPAGGHT